MQALIFFGISLPCLYLPHNFAHILCNSSTSTTTYLQQTVPVIQSVYSPSIWKSLGPIYAEFIRRFCWAIKWSKLSNERVKWNLIFHLHFVSLYEYFDRNYLEWYVIALKHVSSHPFFIIRVKWCSVSKSLVLKWSAALHTLWYQYFMSLKIHNERFLTRAWFSHDHWARYLMCVVHHKSPHPSSNPALIRTLELFSLSDLFNNSLWVAVCVGVVGTCL